MSKTEKTTTTAADSKKAATTDSAPESKIDTVTVPAIVERIKADHGIDLDRKTFRSVLRKLGFRVGSGRTYRFDTAVVPAVIESVVAELRSRAEKRKRSESARSEVDNRPTPVYTLRDGKVVSVSAKRTDIRDAE